MEDTILRRTWAEIDLDALEHNYNVARQKIGPGVKYLGVVKADAYGHGAVQVARKLEQLGADYLAVSSLDEGRELRHGGITMPILILGHTPPEMVSQLIEYNITQAVSAKAKAEAYSAEAVKCGGTLRVHIKVDTGMSRLGYLCDGDHFETGVAGICHGCSLPGLDAEGIFTHFARADELDKTHAERQLKRFRDFIALIKERLGLEIPLKHCSNSAGILEMPDANMDLVRAGITLYGLWPSDEVDKTKISIKPALSLITHVAYVKELEAGHSISYGGTYTTKETRRIATIPVGYADGYARSLSNKGDVLIHGRRAPICGRVCMDQFMVDVTDIPDVTVGDEVILIGSAGEETITMEEVGAISGRFNYEFVCDLGKRIPRVYVHKGKVVGTKDHFSE